MAVTVEATAPSEDGVASSSSPPYFDQRTDGGYAVVFEDELLTNAACFSLRYRPRLLLLRPRYSFFDELLNDVENL